MKIFEILIIGTQKISKCELNIIMIVSFSLFSRHSHSQNEILKNFGPGADSFNVQTNLTFYEGIYQ